MATTWTPEEDRVRRWAISSSGVQRIDRSSGLVVPAVTLLRDLQPGSSVTTAHGVINRPIRRLRDAAGLQGLTMHPFVDMSASISMLQASLPRLRPRSLGIQCRRPCGTMSPLQPWTNALTSRPPWISAKMRLSRATVEKTVVRLSRRRSGGRVSVGRKVLLLKRMAERAGFEPAVRA